MSKQSHENNSRQFGEGHVLNGCGIQRFTDEDEETLSGELLARLTPQQHEDYEVMRSHTKYPAL